jgi:hypothetical protein
MDSKERERREGRKDGTGKMEKRVGNKRRKKPANCVLAKICAVNETHQEDGFELSCTSHLTNILMNITNEIYIYARKS